MTIAALQQMKRDGQKIAGVVAWDTPMAKIADRAGVELVPVGDSVGVNLWGHDDPPQATMDESRIDCNAVRSGTARAQAAGAYRGSESSGGVARWGPPVRVPSRGSARVQERQARAGEDGFVGKPERKRRLDRRP